MGFLCVLNLFCCKFPIIIEKYLGILPVKNDF